MSLSNNIETYYAKNTEALTQEGVISKILHDIVA